MKRNIELDEQLRSNMSERDRERAMNYGIKLAKASMAAELKSQYVSKGYISKHVLDQNINRSIRTAHIVHYASVYLSRLGLELDQVPGTSRSGYTLKSNLPDHLKSITADYFLNTESGDKSRDSEHLGQILLVICLVALHGTVGEHELISSLNQFGIAGKLQETLVQRAVKEDYISLDVISTKNGNETLVQYKLSRRSALEWDANSLANCLKAIYLDSLDFDKLLTQLDHVLAESRGTPAWYARPLILFFYKSRACDNPYGHVTSFIFSTTGAHVVR